MNNHPATDDQSDLKALKSGSESALRRLFDRYFGWLVGELMRFVPDQETAKDIAQDVFVELWRRRDSLEIHTSLRAYLRRAGANRAISYLKLNRQTILTADELFLDGTEHPDERVLPVEQERMEQALQQAINGLPERCRLVFTLSRFSDLSHREIAEKLDISVKTIENQITKAFKLLRLALIKHTDLSPVVILMIKWLLEA